MSSNVRTYTQLHSLLRGLGVGGGRGERGGDRVRVLGMVGAERGKE